jgi:uncharacterized protein (DUF1501 family)
MIMQRRVFVKHGALALLALGLPPEFLTRSLLAQNTAGARKKTLICIFQRGAVDGLSMVTPFGEKDYYARRRSIAVPAPSASGGNLIDLDGFFGLHPALQPLHDLFKRNELAVLHAVGSPHPTRSHFDAQDFMESATPGNKSTRDGWLNRVLAHAADHASGQVAMGSASLRGVAMGAALPKSLRGKQPALAIQDLNRFGVAGGLEKDFEKAYHTEAGTVIGSATDGAFEAIQVLRAANLAQYRPAAGVNYPQGEFGRSLSQVAQLIKSGVGVEIAFVDIGGWDTHQAQGGAEGQLARRLTELARGIRALYDDLGDRMDDVVVLTMSEFGRTVAENGSGGTDHGRATCMFVAGGAVHGGKILGEWPGLATEQLYEGRDLKVTTDFRAVFAELASRHLGAAQLDQVFPGWQAPVKSQRLVLR